MNREYQVSIVIPVYNGEKFIEKTVLHLLNGEYKNLEIVLVNDGSKDDSEAICKRLAETDNRVKYYKKENGGVASARNFGLKKVQGEFVCFYDQDDLNKSDMYACLLDDIVKNNADMVVSNYATYTDNVLEHKVNRLIKSSVLIDTESDGVTDLNKYILSRNSFYEPKYRIYGAIWCCMYRVSFLRKNGLHFFHFVDYEDDWLFMLKAVSCAKKIFLDERYFYFWKVHASSESHRPKYIPDLYNRRCELKKYIYSTYVDGVMEHSDANNYKGYFASQTLVKIYVNESNQISNFGSYMDAVKLLSEVRKKEIKYVTNHVIKEYEISQGRDRALICLMIKYHMGFLLLLKKLIKRK